MFGLNTDLHMATACYRLFLLEGLSKPQHADQDFKHWWFGLPSCETWTPVWNSRVPSHRKKLGMFRSGGGGSGLFLALIGIVAELNLERYKWFSQTEHSPGSRSTEAVGCYDWASN